MSLDYEKYPVLGYAAKTAHEHYRVNPMGLTFTEWCIVRPRLLALLDAPAVRECQFEHTMGWYVGGCGTVAQMLLEGTTYDSMLNQRIVLLDGTVIKEWTRQVNCAKGEQRDKIILRQTNRSNMYTISKTIKQPVAYLRARCRVRYWEGGIVNGVEDIHGRLMPLRDGESWHPTIDLETGVIENWPHGTSASIRYKVCDGGVYELLDIERNIVATKDGYVPVIMCPNDYVYGDYVIMSIGPEGKIKDWRVDLEAWEP